MATNIASLPSAYRRKLLNISFRLITFGMVIICMIFLAFLLGRLFYQGGNAFYHYKINLPVKIDLSITDIITSQNPTKEDLQNTSFSPLLQKSVIDQLDFDVEKSKQKHLFSFLSPESLFQLRDYIIDHPEAINDTVTFPFEVSSQLEYYLKNGRKDLIHHDINTKLKVEFDHPDFDFKKGLRIFSTEKTLSQYMKNVLCMEQKSGLLKCTPSQDDPSFFIRIGKLYGKIERLDLSQDGKETVFVRIYHKIEQDFVSDISHWTLSIMNVPQKERKISDISMVLCEVFLSKGLIHSSFPNIPFFSKADSRNPEQAGILGAFIGSLMTIIVCFLMALPVGICAAVYLEEFTSKSPIATFFEININNLASVPSIIYGLLGLSLLLNIFGLPRSAPLVGGIVLGIMSLPVVIIATRTALRTVPKPIRDGAIALGATKVQAFFHHILPNALPGIMTGVVLAISRAIGETAPLLLIGMVAFISDIPQTITDAATVLPVQIFLWSENPEIAYIDRTAAAILILLLLMICLNGFAVYLRNKFETKY